MNSESPRIGVGVIIVRQGLVLLGQRKGSHGSGSWAVPGGHLEFGETVENCARRETLEETGILLGNIALGPFTNNVFELERKHYVTLFVTSNSFDGEPKALEPEKCSQWVWCAWSSLPSPLIELLENLRSRVRTCGLTVGSELPRVLIALASGHLDHILFQRCRPHLCRS
jgi:8-oxo-dGTP diphosphatase